MTLVYRAEPLTRVLGRGETVGQELAGNPKVAMVSMTGSVGAGEKIMAAAAKKHHQSLSELRQGPGYRDGRC